MLAAVAAFTLGCRGKTPDQRLHEDASPPPALAAQGATGTDCGALGCRLFDSPEDAMRAALAGNPLVVAVGEAHALAGTEHIDSSARRFTRDLLPELKGRASDLLLELMMPRGDCKAKTEEARTAQKPATRGHAESDQEEYVAMGNAARSLGIIPDVLRPSCDDLGAIGDAGDDAIVRTLETINRLTVKQVEALMGRKDRDAGAAIIVYGGALHNDPTPDETEGEVADWSYGPALSNAVNGRYVAVNLFVREYIKDDATWRKWAWYPHFDRERSPEKTTMFHPKADVYVLIFPASR